MSESKHVKNLVNTSLARLITQELMAENAKLGKREKALFDMKLTDTDEFESIRIKMFTNLELLDKMSTVLEMEDLYKNGTLPQGYTFDPQLSGLNNPLNR
jgi:hypothetical protein